MIIKYPEYADLRSRKGVQPTRLRSHCKVPIFVIYTTRGNAAEVTIHLMITEEEKLHSMETKSPLTKLDTPSLHIGPADINLAVYGTLLTTPGIN
ncbi:MAG: hypothetical protein ACFC1C_02750 [Candidatus Malihini olakiniferum]